MSLPAALPLAESDTGKGSPIGLFVVLLLVIAVYLLYRSMTGHLRRLPEKFPQAEDSAEHTDDRSAGPDEQTRESGPGNPTGPNGERPGPS